MFVCFFKSSFGFSLFGAYYLIWVLLDFSLSFWMKFEFGFIRLQANSVFLLLVWREQLRFWIEVWIILFLLGLVCEIEIFFRGLCSWILFLFFFLFFWIQGRGATSFLLKKFLKKNLIKKKKPWKRASFWQQKWR